MLLKIIKVVIIIISIIVLVPVIIIGVDLGIGTYQSHVNISDVRRAIDAHLASHATMTQTLAFLQTHPTFTLNYGHGLDVSTSVQGREIVAEGLDDQGDEFRITFIFDDRRHMRQYSVDDTWLHMP